jgi:Reverse transcriptase (RNA-dependent DNA polymerase)
LIKAARQWWKKFKAAMNKLIFYPSLADPCIFTKKETSTSSPSFVILYVVDGVIFGTQKDLDGIIKGLSKEFVIKSLGPMKDFVGCQIIEIRKKDSIWIHQPKLLKNLKKEFLRMWHNRSFSTPASPKSIIMRPKEGDLTIDPIDQKLFRTGAGMLLFLVKHSRPDI